MPSPSKTMPLRLTWKFELSQQNLTVCAGSQYKFAAQFYMTDTKAIPSPQTYVLVYVNG